MTPAMRDQSSTRPRAGARLALCAALTTALLAAAPAAADSGHATKPADATRTSATPFVAGPQKQGASAEEHAGMTAGEHTAMQPADKSEGAAAGHGEHDAAAAAGAEAEPGASGNHGAAADEHGAGDREPAADGRPVGLLLGGFGALNGLVLIAAAVLRRRGPAAKRRATLARVRATAGAATVPRAPTVERRS
jgi:hypothetical protein